MAKLLPNRQDVDIIDWTTVENVTKLVADKTMQRSDLEFGPISVKIYAAGPVLRIDIQDKYSE
ncbi:MAG TPA: hypothetical protein VF733_07140 [Candidatus Saccharimonadales bacterium]